MNPYIKKDLPPCPEIHALFLSKWRGMWSIHKSDENIIIRHISWRLLIRITFYKFHKAQPKKFRLDIIPKSANDSDRLIEHIWWSSLSIIKVTAIFHRKAANLKRHTSTTGGVQVHTTRMFILFDKNFTTSHFRERSHHVFDFLCECICAPHTRGLCFFPFFSILTQMLLLMLFSSEEGGEFILTWKINVILLFRHICYLLLVFGP